MNHSARGDDTASTLRADDPATVDGRPLGAEDDTMDKPADHLPFIEAATDVPAADAPPTWRGWIHAGLLPFVVAAGLVLLCLADGPVAKISSAVFFASSLLLFGNSALYHRFAWKPRTKMILRRIDHSNIFLLIAGTYTPLAALCLPTPQAIILLSAIWGVAVLGIAFKVFWIGAPRWLYVPIYILMGWAALMFTGDFINANPASMLLVAIGGLFYTVGAVFYGIKRPNPLPGVFGFHEIFHALTALAFICHWTAILLVAINPPVLG